MLPQMFQYFSCSFYVEFLVIGMDKDIIHVDNQPSFCYEITEDVVHQCLKGGRRVA